MTAIPEKPAATTVSQFEKNYLANNPDVAKAVEEGIFSSGLEHYKRHGHTEDRNLGGVQPPQLVNINSTEIEVTKKSSSEEPKKSGIKHYENVEEWKKDHFPELYSDQWERQHFGKVIKHYESVEEWKKDNFPELYSDQWEKNLFGHVLSEPKYKTYS